MEGKVVIDCIHDALEALVKDGHYAGGPVGVTRDSRGRLLVVTDDGERAEVWVVSVAKEQPLDVVG